MGTRELLEKVLERVERVEQLLTEKSDEVLDARGACRLTGLSKASLYAKTCSKNGEPPVMPHFKTGKRIYFRKSELEAWMTANRVEDRGGIEREAEAYLATRARRPAYDPGEHDARDRGPIERSAHRRMPRRADDRYED